MMLGRSITFSKRFGAMNRASTLILSSEKEVCVFLGTAMYAVSKGRPLFLPVERDAELYFTLWSVSDNNAVCFAVPALHRIRIEEGRAVDSSIRVFDWEGVIEGELEPKILTMPVSAKPMLLDRTEYVFGERKATAELYRDNGLRLALTPAGGETFSFPVGEGDEGRLGVIDTGRTRLLTVNAKAGRTERLVIVDPRADIVFEGEADVAGITEGYPTLIRELNTVRKHQQMERYSLSSSGAELYDRRIGFFTRASIDPQGGAETVLSVIQELRLGVYDLSYGISGELAAETSVSDLKAYFGEFDAERLYPAEEGEGRVTVGLYNDVGRIIKPRRFLFELSDGLISDIREF